MPINRNIYTVDWNKLVAWLLPSEVLQHKMFAWCKGLISPIGTTLANFMTFRKQRLYDLSITPQVASLERMLNNKFDYSLRRIFISEGTNDKKLFVYKRSEETPLTVYTAAENKPTYIYKRNELTVTVIHFVVNIPATLTVDLNVVKSVLNIYKLPDKNYRIDLV